jgi:hypothetical protein
MLSDHDTGCQCATLAGRVFGPGCVECAPHGELCGLLIAAGEREDTTSEIQVVETDTARSVRG